VVITFNVGRSITPREILPTEWTQYFESSSQNQPIFRKTKGELLGSVQQFGFSLDFYSPPGIEEALHNDHRGCRKRVAKALAMGTTHPFPVGGIDNIESRSHHVFPPPAKGFDGFENDFETAGGLHVGVALDGFTLVVKRRCPGNADTRAATDGTREPDQLFVGRCRVEPSGGRGIVVLFHVAAL
jgi:hypothetical protein